MRSSHPYLFSMLVIYKKKMINDLYLLSFINFVLGFPGGSDGKESAHNAGDRFNPWVGKILWRRAWQPTSVFLPGESHGQRTLVGYSPWGRTVRHD